MRRTRTLLKLILMLIVALGVSASSLDLRSPQRMASALPFFQTNDQSTCRDIDRSYVQFDALLRDEAGYEPGRVLSLNDGTLAVLLVVTETNDSGSAIAVDFATSVRIGALIIRSADAHDVRTFDPAVRSGSGLRAPDNAAIDAISFCYRVSILAPPKPATAEAPSAKTHAPDATNTPSPTATVLTLDLSEAKTARARAAEIEATATAAAQSAANTIATEQANASEIASTATAAAIVFDETRTVNDATIAGQQDELATLQAEVDSAQATAESLQATLAAPTMTPMPTMTPAPTETVNVTETPAPTQTATPTPFETAVVYETSGNAPFADWQPVEGWDLTEATAKSDGTGAQAWQIVPVPPGLSPNTIVEIEFKTSGGEICPRNFGLAVRGSETGYYAAGVEWACDPEVLLWAGADVITSVQLDKSNDLSTGWHHLQLSAIGSEIRVTIDGVEVVAVSDDRYPAGNLVALWTDGVGLEIKHVRVSEVRQ